MLTLQELLAQLGDTEEEVFKTLKEKGIKGSKGCAHSCVIANYLATNLGELVGVDGFEACTYQGCCRKERAELPESVALLIRHFDNDMYPELEEDNADKGHAAGKTDHAVPGESEP